MATFECRCGKYSGAKYIGVICDKCGKEVFARATTEDENLLILEGEMEAIDRCIAFLNKQRRYVLEDIYEYLKRIGNKEE